MLKVEFRGDHEAAGVYRRAAVTWPLSVGAQQSAIPVIGFLDPRSPEGVLNRLRGLREGLKETGFVEGENVTVEYRWAENQWIDCRNWRLILCAGRLR